ncbi:MAG TPA: DMT family transporter [bacterium]|nr:DMT family transporter [bacterium]
MSLTGSPPKDSGRLARGVHGARPLGPAREFGPLLLLALIWGGSVPLTKLGLREIPPLTLTALRYVVAAPCFVWLLRGRPLPPPRSLAAAAGLGVLGIAVGQLSQTLGVGRTSASVATVISATIPILVVVFARIRLRQAIALRQGLGFAVALGGVALVATGDPRHLMPLLTSRALGGEALVLFSAVTIALYYVMSVELVGRYSVITIAAVTSLAGTLALIPVAAWELRHAALRLTGEGVAVVGYLALLVTVVGLLIWFRALHRLPASAAAALQYLQPIVGVGASAALFGDPLGTWFGVGTGLVFLGIALSTTGQPAGATSPSS